MNGTTCFQILIYYDDLLQLIPQLKHNNHLVFMEHQLIELENLLQCSVNWIKKFNDNSIGSINSVEVKWNARTSKVRWLVSFSLVNSMGTLQSVTV